MALTLQQIRQIMEEMERDGFLYRTGEFRKNPQGQMRPVYALTELGKAQAERDRLLRSGQKAH